MRVVVLSPSPERVLDIFKNNEVVTSQSHNGPIPKCDFVVSYGHRHIIKPEVIAAYKDRIINVHIGYLPWNRGADPNFWSWFDNSPKGVTIHHIDDGIDTGDIVSQFKVRWTKPEKETLASTYNALHGHAKLLLHAVWQKVRDGEALPRVKQAEGGSFHKSAELKALRLPEGWRTPVQYVEAMGRQVRGEE